MMICSRRAYVVVLFCVWFAAVSECRAELQLAPVFTDNMVLQVEIVER